MKRILTGFFYFVIVINVQAQSPRISFAAPQLYPEGVAYDPSANVFYVSSVTVGTIGKVDEQGKYTKFYEDRSLKSSFGMKIDLAKSWLWVCIGDPNYSLYRDSSTFKKMIRLVAIDLKTGKKIKDIDLSKLYPGKHFANDLTFDNNGNLYVTDSFSPVIYKVNSEGNASVLVQSDLFKSPDVGLNGIAWFPDGYLLVVNNGNGSVLKVTTATPVSVSRVNIPQFFPGADGLLRMENNDLILVQNKGVNKIFRLKSADNWKTAVVNAATIAEDRFQQPSTLVQQKEKLFALNSKLNELQDKSVKPSDEFSIQLIQFKPVQ